MDCCSTKHSPLAISQESTKEEFIKGRRSHSRCINHVGLVILCDQVIRHCTYSPCRSQQINGHHDTCREPASWALSGYLMSEVECEG